MIPTLDIGHVVPQLRRTAIAVCIKAEFFAGLGELIKIESGLFVIHVGDSMSKEGFALGIDKPVTVFDFGQSDRGERRVLSSKWQREQEGECEEEFQGRCRDGIHFVALAGGEHK
jgi:hypothetical protein